MEIFFKILFPTVLAFLFLSSLLGCKNRSESDYADTRQQNDTDLITPEVQRTQQGDVTDYMLNGSRHTKEQPVKTAATPDDAYDDGYNNGYFTGKEDGENGHSREYDYDDSSDYHDYYATRYQEGYEEGYEEGYNEGHYDYETQQEEQEDEDGEDYSW